MMPQAVEGIWICTGGSGEWVIESLVPQQSHKSLSLMQQVSFSPASQSEKIPTIYLSIKFSTTLGPSLQR